MIGGKQIHIKTVHDFTEAVAHRLAAEQCLGYNSCDNQSSAYLYMQKYLKEGGISNSAFLDSDSSHLIGDGQSGVLPDLLKIQLNVSPELRDERPFLNSFFLGFT